MARARQTNGAGGHVAAASQHYLTEGTPPTGATAIAWRSSETEPEVMHPPKPFTAAIYGRALAQDLTVALYGRLKVTGPDEAGAQQTVTGAWVLIKTNTFTAAAAASFIEVKLSDLLAAPNEFKLHWSAPATGGATSQAGVSFS
jgi:hypothetical protein